MVHVPGLEEHRLVGQPLIQRFLSSEPDQRGIVLLPAVQITTMPALPAQQKRKRVASDRDPFIVRLGLPAFRIVVLRAATHPILGSGRQRRGQGRSQSTAVLSAWHGYRCKSASIKRHGEPKANRHRAASLTAPHILRYAEPIAAAP